MNTLDYRILIGTASDHINLKQLSGFEELFYDFLNNALKLILRGEI